MGNVSSKVSDTIDEVRTEAAATVAIVALRADHTTFLLTNAVLGLTAVSTLGLLHHLTHFSPLLRAVIWIMIANICPHMVFIYVRHSRSPPLLVPQQKPVNDSANKEKANKQA
jgi:hypothetical protein